MQKLPDEMFDKNTKNDDPLKEECGICGKEHWTTQCSILPIIKQIPDNKIPPKARLTLPHFMELKKLVDGSSEVFTKIPLQKGIQFGPIQAKKILTLNPCIRFPIKVFCDGEDPAEYFLDTSDENECNWLMLVSSAVDRTEQNLICYQDNTSVYFATIKSVKSGEPLKVWYSPYYAERMKSKLLPERPRTGGYFKITDLNVLVQQQQKIMMREVWNCKFCSQVHINIVTFAKHLMEHYRAQMRRVCDICQAVFGTRRMLKKHLAIVHYNKITVATKNTSRESKILQKKSDNEKVTLGGPLLNNLPDSMDNSNLFLQQTDLNQIDMETQNSLLDSDNESYSVDLPNDNVKELDHFNFELNDVEEQIICDICLKTFNKIPALIQHLKQHTGEFHCKHCDKIYCRKENLLGHACLKSPMHECIICHKGFFQQKYLNQHIKAYHKHSYTCLKCKKIFRSKYEWSFHNCDDEMTSDKQLFNCPDCEKHFPRYKYLKRHMTLHQSEFKQEMLICAFCSKFYTRRALGKHMREVHGDPRFKCDVCVRTFTRKSIWRDHMKCHTGEEMEECSICNKKFRTKQLLKVHMITHTQERKYRCKLCTMSFKFSSSLHRHTQTKHKDKEKNDIITKYDLRCPKCDKTMKLKSSLTRHIRKQHPDFYAATTVQSKATACDKNLETILKIEDVGDMEDEFMENIDFGGSVHSPLDIHMEEVLTNSTNLQKHRKASNKMPREETKGTKDSTEKLISKEVCLSMPDLTETDHEIKLGKNAYILNNGNIIEPQDNPDSVVIYLLDQKY